MNTYFIIDFDSTFVTVESLDELANIVLQKNPRKEQILQEIKDTTALAMEGKITFPKSLAKRLSLFQPHQKDIKILVSFLKKHITPSVKNNKQFFKQNSENVYIISGGFKEFIIPIVKQFGIKESHVLANTFVHDAKGNVIGFDKNNLLSQEEGKVKQIKRLELHGQVYIIGDGYTDYEIKAKGHADKFFAFIENVQRQSVVEKSDETVASFDELLYKLNLPREVSFPKSMMKVLLVENIDDTATQFFRQQGYTVENTKHALSEIELTEKMKDISILGIRSKTELTEDVLNKSNKLLVIGAYCIGTNQIDLRTASQKGIAVFNAPYSNTRSVVELALGEIIMLSRNITDKSTMLHQGIWNKSSTGSYEIRGKTLGIVGYGNIGSQLSVLAESLGMHVCFYDIADKLALGNTKRCATLEELLKTSDIVTIHVDGRKSNTNLLGEKEFSLMKQDALFLNLSRGFVVDINALQKYLQSEKIAGAAVDVFPTEPKSNNETFSSPLQHLPNVILTPHIAGSTVEAQKNIAEFVTQKITQFIDTGNTTLSVNFPNIQLPELTDLHRFIHIHRNKPGILAQINNIFAKNAINIEGQYLKTNEEIGYVITDVNKNYSKEVIDELKSIPDTIRVRILY